VQVDNPAAKPGFAGNAPQQRAKLAVLIGCPAKRAMLGSFE
jgi:hypothetical protein